MPRINLKPVVSKFHRSEDGVLTIFGLYIFMLMMLLGGLVIDVNNAVSARTQLQIAADVAAHAALLAREQKTESEAIEAAIEVAKLNMPYKYYKDVLTAEDIHFGVWDVDERSFQLVSGSKEGVHVNTSRLAEKGNGVATFLLKLVNVKQWQMRSQSVFVTYRPSCLREGFVAEGMVDIQSNNSFTSGFCIHSNDHVSLNNDNYFEPGTVVSMTNLSDLDMPNSGFEKNEGLESALQEGGINIRILDRIGDIITGLEDYSSEFMPDYIDDFEVYSFTGKKIDSTSLVPGRIYKIECAGKGRVAIENDTVLTGVVITSNCQFNFGTGVSLEDTVIATSSTSARSFKGAANVRVGRDDNCAPGGGAQLVTQGGMDFPAALHIDGGQLLAARNIEFSANAIGIKGASIVSGGEVSGTSNMEMGFCDAGMEDNFESDYYRLAY